MPSSSRPIVVLLATVGVLGGGEAVAREHHPHHERAIPRHHAHARLEATPAHSRPYGPAADPTPTCRDAAGRPLDPDIIGGANHVGDGGPAVNQLGFDPCGY